MPKEEGDRNTGVYENIGIKETVKRAYYVADEMLKARKEISQ